MIMFPVSALLIAGALALAAPAALAETTPRPGSHDNRVRVATWTEGQVYRIVTTLTRVTTVEFGEGETIRSIIAGDTVGFQFDGVPGGRAFAIKPAASGVALVIAWVTISLRTYLVARERPANALRVPHERPAFHGGELPAELQPAELLFPRRHRL